MITPQQYYKIARLIRNMKYIHGGEFVNATLIRHGKLKQALLDYEKCAIIDLESEILNKGVQ